MYHLHCQGFVYSGLRLENIKFNQQGDVKLAGLGHATRHSEYPCYSAVCAEPYSSPEMFTACFPLGFLPEKAAIYSLGIIFLAIRIGYLPPIQPYPLGSIELQDERFWDCLEIMSKTKLDNVFRRLIKSMVTPNIEQRLNIEQVLIHSWLCPDEGDDESMSEYPTQA